MSFGIVVCVAKEFLGMCKYLLVRFCTYYGKNYQMIFEKTQPSPTNNKHVSSNFRLDNIWVKHANNSSSED